MKERLQSLIGHWRASGIEVRPGASVEELASAEKRLGVRLPKDMSEYFRTVDGMPDGVMDPHHFRFWTLQEVKTVSNGESRRDSPASRYFVFADYSISAYEYSIQLIEGASPTVVISNGLMQKAVAESFDDFLSKYLDNPDSLF